MASYEKILNAYQVLKTQELDEARAAVASRYCDHKLNLVRGHNLHVQYNHVRGRYISWNVLSYGADIIIDPGELQHFYLLQIPFEGKATVQHRGEEIAANSECATIINPDRPTHMLWGKDCKKLMVQIDALYLARIASEEIGAPLPGPIRFDPRISLNHSKGRKLRDLVRAILHSIEANILKICPENLSLLALERDFVVALLTLQNSNISHLLKKQKACGTQRQLRRAISYIHENLHLDLRTEEIADSAFVHKRNLQILFKNSLGLSPMTYLRNVRLDHARYYLLQRRNRSSISEIAYDCGYNHLGRFSRDYRDRFGHTPRETR